MKKIDIIIPVYNAPEELRECVESILRFEDTTSYQIIIINDCSPDAEVKKYLATLSNIENIHILENEYNLGFVGTVNKGMMYSENDVILLNSDTVVTKSWLRKLKEAAYSHESIATVTPFTNNGTICSVPNFNEDNEIPDGFTVETFSTFVEHVSEKKYPEIPTAVGFCMYIKRSVINVVGLFDAETFGKGYGEENDFCCRVIEHGYINILADDTFIYHKGSMSFQGDKSALLLSNLAKLNKRYPYYEKKIHDFVFQNNTIMPLLENIKVRMSQYKDSSISKKNILYIMHNFFDFPYNHPVGGTEFHVKDLTEELSHEYNVYIMVTNGREIVLKQYREQEEVAKLRFALKEELLLTHFSHREYSELLSGILTSFNIHIVHIHHLIKHSFDAPSVAKKLGIPVIMTLHDFYLFCPKINLLDEKNQFCLDKRSEEKCGRCLGTTHQFHTNFLKTWKEKVFEMMKFVDLFITPSNTTKNMFEVEFPDLVGKLVSVEHGINWGDQIKSDLFMDSTKSNFNVGFLGGLAPTKGSDLIYKFITAYSKNNITWHLIGGIGDQRLNLVNKKNVVKHGRYNKEEISGILKENKIDIILLLSPWPETYSYTLSEAWSHDIPVLVTPIGALKERVSAVGGGWIADSMNYEDISIKLNEVLVSYPDSFSKAIQSIRESKKKDINYMINEYSNIYKKHLVDVEAQKDSTISKQRLVDSIKYYQAPELDRKSDSYVIELETELYRIKSTIGWKIMNRLRQYPFVVRFGKRTIFSVLRLKSKFKR